MKKNIKKFLAVVLTVAVLSTCGFSLVANARISTAIPTVYVHGQGNIIFADSNDGNSEKIWYEKYPEDGLDGFISAAAAPLAKGIVSGDYSEYAELLCTTFEPWYAKSVLGPTGDVTDGSGNSFINNNTWFNRPASSGYYRNSFDFSYDWRKDPVQTAAELDAYIDKVIAGTGYKKVNLVGRCLGSNIVLAYLNEYNEDTLEKINKVAFYCSGFDGFDLCNALFSGQIVVLPDALDRYLQSNVEDDGGILDFLKATVNVLRVTQGLQLSIDEIMDVYEKISSTVVPRMLNMSFGTFPAYWSMVGDKYFEDAKELYFSDKNKDEYSEFIRKIDYYHYNIGNKAAEIINNLIDNNINVFIVSKYDEQMIPVSENANLQADDYVCVPSSSFGATVTNIGESFSKKYMTDAENNGTDKYINAEKTIDASTCLLPDHTWFIKNLGHIVMPDSVDDLILSFFNYNGYMTVFDNENTPQYMLYTPTNGNDGTIAPYTADDTTHDEWNPNFFTNLQTFFEHIFSFFIRMIDALQAAINSNNAAIK